MKHPNPWFSILLLCGALSAVGLLSGEASAQLTATANHDRIGIDFFYHGSSVSVRGSADPGCDLIIKIASPEGEQTLKKKGKVAGLLWMNVGSLHIGEVPKVYSLHSTREIREIVSREGREKYVLGYEALEKRADMKPVADRAEKARWFGEFVKFQEHSGLYAASVGKILVRNENGKGNYYTLIQWPYQAPPGVYTVTVYAVKDGKVVQTAETKVSVEQVGLVKRLADMAKYHGGLYGMLSILAALGAGFGVGMVFRKGGGAH
ncbi:MAG: TIGR02186 family protein [Alphaproteobacteria bacterium]|uniref:TIGR02186 family protein n=1 Tax=Candidatus Nitrobium versatile TaxID=2884831 RepID=A0A953J494_9BACT|nr:TIGR02186 family protein [Candidatus Nitrobium versatile]